MYDTILVPLDGSAFSEQVLPMATALARAQEARIKLLRVHSLRADDVLNGADELAGVVPPVADERAESSAYLDDVASSIGGAPFGNVDVALTDDRSIARAICHEGEAGQGVLIAMTTHGRTGLSRSVLGSVADGVLRHTACPVLLWRPGRSGAEVAKPPTHVLLPLDGSTFAENVLPHAAAIADAFRAKVTLLRVIGRSAAVRDDIVALPVYPLFAYGSAVAVADATATQLAAQEAGDYVERIAGRLRREYVGLHVSTRVCIEDHAGNGILKAVAETGADIVAMTTHGRGAGRLLTGSTVDSVMRGRYGATLLVRPP